jgi:hypothetical protein
MIKFEPLTVLYHNNLVLWVAGAQHKTRDDGSGSFLVAQAFGASDAFPVGTKFVDSVGQCWVATSGISSGFFMSGIVLEEGSLNG